MKNISIAYMVAGLARRFEGRPKWMAKVGPSGESFIEYSLNQAISAGIDKVIFIVSDKTRHLFEEIFKDNYKGLPVHYVLQSFDSEKRNRPWGTGDAACAALPLVDGPCIICNGDDMYGEQAFKKIVNHLQTTDEDATSAFKLKDMLPEHGEVTRGIFETENEYLTEAKEIFNISRLNYKEKGFENHLCNGNIFGVQQKTFQDLGAAVVKFKTDNSGDREIECFIHVELANLENSKMRVFTNDDTWLGITNPGDEDKVREALKDIK